MGCVNLLKQTGGENENMEITIRYFISELLKQKIFVETGDKPEGRQEIKVEAIELSRETREKYAALTNRSFIDVVHYGIGHGTIYSDGSVDEVEPCVWTLSHTDQGNWSLEKMLKTVKDAEEIINLMYADKQKAETELAEYKPKWQVALAAYQARQAEQKKQADAVKAATELMQPKINALKERISELENFLGKLIRHTNENALVAAGLVEPFSEEQSEELSQEVQEALRTAGLD